MQRYTTECIVLRAINYKDADKILTLYSKQEGKISASAKGVRRLSSRRAGSLDTLNHVRVGIYTNSSNFKLITEAETLNSFEIIKKELERIKYGFYISELVYKSVQDDQEVEGLFKLLCATLRALNKPTVSNLRVVSFFEINLMKLLGYQMCLDSCVFCGTPFSAEWGRVRFSMDNGGFCCASCASGGVSMPLSVASELSRLVLAKNLQDQNVSNALVMASDILRGYIKEKLGVNFNTMRVFDV